MKIARTLILSMSAALAGLLVMQSCTSNPESPGLEYMPDMYRSQAYEAYSTSPFGKGGSSRQPVAGTVSRSGDGFGIPQFEPYPYPNSLEGYEAAGAQLVNPLPVNEQVLKNGEYLFVNFCSHCHGVKGDGNGILVERDKYAGVPSYYGAQLKDLPVGKMYHTVYYGKNMMGPHRQLINHAERWAVIRWVEKLRADGLQGAVTDTTAKPVSDTTAVMPAGKTTLTK